MKERTLALLVASAFIAPAFADDIGHGYPYGAIEQQPDDTNETQDSNLWEQVLEWFELEEKESESE